MLLIRGAYQNGFAHIKSDWILLSVICNVYVRRSVLYDIEIPGGCACIIVVFAFAWWKTNKIMIINLFYFLNFDILFHHRSFIHYSFIHFTFQTVTFYPRVIFQHFTHWTAPPEFLAREVVSGGRLFTHAPYCVVRDFFFFFLSKGYASLF